MLKDLLTKNIGLKFLAAILSVLLWILARGWLLK